MPNRRAGLGTVQAAFVPQSEHPFTTLADLAAWVAANDPTDPREGVSVGGMLLLALRP
jgi:hypothetical protein